MKKVLILATVLFFIFGSFFSYTNVLAAPGNFAWKNITTAGGLGDPDNLIDWDMIEFNGDIYVSVGENDSPLASARVYRYDGDFNWPQVNLTGFGDPQGIGAQVMEVYNGYLYVGAENLTSKGEVWRSRAVGGPPFTDWELVSPDLSAPSNEGVIGMQVFKDYLYISVQDTGVTGAKIYRTKGVGGPPFTDWTEITGDGFGDAANKDIRLSAVDGFIYAVIINDANGGEIWRSADGISWSKVVDGGFGDSRNGGFFNIIKHGGLLYTGVLTDGSIPGSVYSSFDGASWTVINADGFGDINNIGLIPISSVNGKLIISSFNTTTGTEVWTLDGADFKQVNEDGFDLGATNVGSLGAIPFNGTGIMMGTFSLSPNGTQIYSEFPSVGSAATGAQTNDASGHVDIGFKVDDSESADNIIALVEYNVGDGWKKATLSELDTDTTASTGDPKVDNAAEYQLGSATGFIETNSETTVNTVWDSKTDEPNVNTDEAYVRICPYDQILISDCVVTPAFSLSNIPSVVLTKTASVDIARLDFIASAASTDNDQLIGATKIANKLGGVLGTFGIDRFIGGGGTGFIGKSLNFFAQFIHKAQETNLIYLIVTILSLIALVTYIRSQAGRRRLLSQDVNFLDTYSNSAQHPLVKYSYLSILVLSISSIALFSILYNSNSTTSAPFDVNPGDVINYKVEYENTSNIPATDVVIKDAIPAYTAYVQGTLDQNVSIKTDAKDADTADFNGTTLHSTHFNIGTVPAGGKGYISFKVRVNANAPMGGQIVSQAEANFNPGANISLSNITTNTVIATGEISGVVYNDTNRNGLYEQDLEFGISKVQVNLYEDTDASGTLNTSTDYFVTADITDSSGRFAFTGLSSKAYLIYVIASTLPQNYNITTANNPGRATLSTSDQVYSTAHFGYVGQGQLPVTPDEPEPVVTPTEPTKPIDPETPTEPEIPIKPEEPTEIDTTPIQDLDRDQDKTVDDQKDQVKATEEKTEGALNAAATWVKENKDQVANATIAALVLAAIANVISAIGSGVMFPSLLYLFQLFTEPWLLIGRKKRKEWGVVYDSLTKQPVDLVLVRLYDQATNKIVETKVTDIDGRYLFVVDKDKSYYIKTEKTNYTFPSRLLNNAPTNTDYDNLYYGEVLTPTTKEGSTRDGIIVKNIPIDQVERMMFCQKHPAKQVPTMIKNVNDLALLTPAQLQKEDKNIRKHSRNRRINLCIAYLGPIVSLITLIIVPGVISAVLFALHIILLLLFMRLTKARKPKPWGKVYDRRDSQPVPQAVVRLFDQKYGRLVLSSLTKSDGRYGFLIGSERYYVTPSKQSYTFPEQKVEVDGHDKELIKSDLGMERG